jgi:hypothetical protein
MALATRKQKQQRSKNKNAKAPEEWKDAVAASADLDDEDDDDGTGVTHEGGQPIYLEKLTAEERLDVGDKLSKKLLLIAEKEQKAKDAAGAARNELKDLREDRDKLRDEWLSGMRKRPAQQSLPAVES